ncbi:Uncharacterised protein [Staphylococcus intermedius NCTC 11048]|uniref:Uncharacterized protein n=1 Tax=Staphylococcus intermedius NCTC 11048 TaxID=1141106 RepID=A0A380G6M0_STAIN|nr:hypothetical protein [Staphylococcus intermedius]SUM45933.1 Uncharacterised protein [Staphylococcus intermedius NCTC 11048]
MERLTNCGGDEKKGVTRGSSNVREIFGQYGEKPYKDWPFCLYIDIVLLGRALNNITN